MKRYPGYFGEYTWSETEHNGYPTSGCGDVGRQHGEEWHLQARARLFGLMGRPPVMLASIFASGLAVGAMYALIGVTYNTMFSTSRVMSFTAGQLGMVGGVFGSLFVLAARLAGCVRLAADARLLRDDRSSSPSSSRCGRC